MSSVSFQDVFGSISPRVPSPGVPARIHLHKDVASYSIGSSDICDIQITGHELVEEYHCTIQYDFETGMATVKDRSGHGGTWLNGTKVSTYAGQTQTLRGEVQLWLGAPILPGSFGFVYKPTILHSPVLEDRYVIQWDMPLGAGASGVVWKARKRLSYGPNAVRRAIKTLHYETGDEQRRAAIINEVEIAKQLSHHPNICSFFEVLEDPSIGQMYVVLELVEGLNLEEYVLRKSRRRPGKGLGTLLLLRSVHFADDGHSCLLWQNILLSLKTGSAPTVKVSDFGLSKRFKEDVLQTVCGTLAYVAPEVAHRHHFKVGYDEGVDGWSIGVIVIFMLTSSSPFIWPRTFVTDLWKQLDERRLNMQQLYSVTSDKDCLDFVNSLLVPEPAARLSVTESLNHAWLSQI
ncbi:unnamed protein product [Peniophora sp. CBMAI 1063]|nr:unnamed protein product [Peniophora sp. CBMAI 1063]